MTEPLTFREKYKGPNGPHLNCLTEFTRKGTWDPARQHSIHPRVVDGRQRYAKSNTCKKKGA